jgi:hypothetical protein
MDQGVMKQVPGIVHIYEMHLEVKETAAIFPPAPEGTIYLSPEERLTWLALRKLLFARS